MCNLHVCGYWHSRGRKQLAWLYKQNYILSLIYCTQGITQYTVSMTTADEVNNKIWSVKSDFDDTASCGYSSVLRFLSYVDAKLRGHRRLRFERNLVPVSVVLRLVAGTRSPGADSRMDAPTMMSERRKMAAPHVAKHRRSCQSQETSHSWVTWAEKVTKMEHSQSHRVWAYMSNFNVIILISGRTFSSGLLR